MHRGRVRYDDPVHFYDPDPAQVQNQARGRVEGRPIPGTSVRHHTLPEALQAGVRAAGVEMMAMLRASWPGPHCMAVTLPWNMLLEHVSNKDVFHNCLDMLSAAFTQTSNVNCYYTIMNLSNMDANVRTRPS